MKISRRAWMMGATSFAAGSRFMSGLSVRGAGVRPEGMLIESHIHLFADDPVRFPYNSGAYKPQRLTLEEYLVFARAIQLDHAVIVHPEPYQDDYRYTDYCLEHEPSPGFFKATCLFDPVSPDTPARMQALVKRHPNRIVALRIHETHEAGTPSTRSGVIRDRDLHDPQMLVTWRKAHTLGLAIQLHFIPHYAEQIGSLVKQFPQMPVVLDHLARPGQGTAEEYGQVLSLAKFPQVVMKYSSTGLETIPSAADRAPLIKRVYEAFGADRIIWGCLGGSAPEFAKEAALFDQMFAFAQEPEKAKIRGLNSRKLFRFA